MPQKNEWLSRSAGILLPVSSLPGKYGIGSFGNEAKRWIDFLHDAGQKYWQVLPLGPTGFGNSPYQSVSAFAGNPWFVDLNLLKEKGLLTKKEVKSAKSESPADQVDYPGLEKNRESLLRTAFSRFEDREALERFRRRNRYWIEDYALFVSIKSKMDGRPWYEWDDEIRLRKPEALIEWREKCEEDILYHIFVQYIFFSQFNSLRKYAKKRGIKIIGDAPIYVSMDSADIWSHTELFQLDENYLPTEVAGCPPDAFSDDGQLWGNPLYRWDEMQNDDFSWWIRRLKANFSMFDVVRIDHFRGLESYYAIPYGEPTARNGRWRKGPGRAFIKAVRENLPGAAIIAEDLGYLTPAVHRLLKFSGYPGMKVLQFAFDSDTESDYMPHNFERNSIVYTGTHDNDTTLGWFSSSPEKAVKKALEYSGCAEEREGLNGFIRMALSSVSDLAVIPMQDYLAIGPEGRINTPSTVGPENWRWRMKRGALTPELASEIREITELYGRNRPEEKKTEKRKVKPKTEE